MFLVLHVLIVAAPPVSVRPDLYLAFAGVSALSVMLRFTLPGQLVTKTILSLAPMLAIWLALGYSDTYRPSIVQPGMFVGGLLSLAISFAAMRYVVTHSSRLYQPQMLPVRFGN